jgi:hypothetical protein
VDPWVGLLAGLAAGAPLLIARNTWWSASPLAGRIAIALSMPLLGAFLATSVLDPSGTPLLALVPAAAVIGLVEAWGRRRGDSLLRRFPLLATLMLFTLGALFGALLIPERLVQFDVAAIPRLAHRPPPPPSWSAAAKREAVDLVRAVISGRSPKARDRPR